MKFEFLSKLLGLDKARQVITRYLGLGRARRLVVHTIILNSNHPAAPSCAAFIRCTLWLYNLARSFLAGAPPIHFFNSLHHTLIILSYTAHLDWCSTITPFAICVLALLGLNSLTVLHDTTGCLTVLLGTVPLPLGECQASFGSKCGLSSKRPGWLSLVKT